MSAATARQLLASPSAVPGKGAKALVFLIGLLILANLYLLPSALQTPRATDVISAVAAVWMFGRLFTRGVHRGSLRAVGWLGTFFLVWLYIAYVNDWMVTLVLALRWLLGLPLGYALYLVAHETSTLRRPFIYGMWTGAVFNILVLALQAWGLKELTQDIGLAAQDSAASYIYGTFRPPGMHGHPNAALAVVSLALPVSLHLCFAERRGLIWAAAAIGLIFVGASLTLTRSAVLVSSVTLVLAIIAGIIVRRRPAAWLAAVLSIAVLFVYYLGPPGGWERWLDPENLEVNSGGRIATYSASFDLFLERPFGVGWEAHKAIIGASHNAFLNSGLVFGAPAALVLILAIASLASSVLRGSFSLEGLLGLQVLLLFLWEDHHNNPTFIVITCWLIIAWIESRRAAYRELACLKTPVLAEVHGRGRWRR